MLSLEDAGMGCQRPPSLSKALIEPCLKASKVKDKYKKKANTLMAFSKSQHLFRTEVYPWVSQLCEPFYLNHFELNLFHFLLKEIQLKDILNLNFFI